MGEEQTTQEAIMEATYRALCAHGYADLTTESIAAEFEKSKSLIHYYYDTKEELLASFLDYLLDRFTTRVEATAHEDPRERLSTFVDALLVTPGDEENRNFHTALLELRSQAPNNRAYREQFATNDRLVRDLAAEIIEEGIEAGVYAPHDPVERADLLVAALDGHRTRQVVLGEDGLSATETEAFEDRLVQTLLVDDEPGSD